MENYFSKMLEHLRYHEEVVLYGYLPSIPPSEQTAATAFLAKEYEKEALEFPGLAPEFDPVAALWAAQIVFNAAQLMLYRKQNTQEIEPLFADYSGEMTPEVVLSADLMLRFLPDLLEQNKNIDGGDQLTDWLELLSQKWHYSCIRSFSAVGDFDFSWLKTNPLLYQMYINRVIAYKNLKMATHPELVAGVRAALGIYSNVLWKNFYNEIQILHESSR